MVKFSNVFIRDVVLRRLGVRDADVVIGPRVGEDAAVVKIDGKYLATHVDPVTGSSNLLGWLAIHVGR
jgi:Hydrogenase maturation factor